MICVCTQENDDEEHAFDFEATDLSSWAKGWHEKVYKEDGVNPDITLGELLLMYFEWMSVHQVRSAAMPNNHDGRTIYMYASRAGVGCCGESGV